MAIANPNTAGLRFTRFRDAYGYMGHALSALASNVQHLCARARIVPVTGLAQGRIVSISRGSPPPKKR